MWVLLLEKAYAKLHGGYAALHLGADLTAFHELTGSPVFYLCVLIIAYHPLSTLLTSDAGSPAVHRRLRSCWI